MMSKNLFFKLIREDCKQRLWCFVLAMVVFFFTLPVAGALIISASGSSAEAISQSVMSYVSVSGGFIVIVTITGALICGVSGFAYLQSRKKVDFYHSIPVKRETLFAVFYLDGILMYLVPYLISLLLFFLVTVGYSQNKGLMISQAFSYMGMNLAYYLLIYTVAVLAVMLTGNLLSSLLGFAVLSFYGVAVQIVNWMYHRYFYDTFWSDKSVTHYHASPIFSYIISIGELSEKLDTGVGDVWMRVAWVLLIWVILLAATLLLYRKRPSESAEKAVAFAKSKPVIYVLISVPAVLTGTMFFTMLTSGFVTVWMLFGLICSWLIVHGILQIVMESEFKAIFRGKIHMGVTGVICAAVLAVFFFDLTGYDSYRPSEDQFYSASIAFSSLNDNVYEVDGQGAYHDKIDIAMERMAYTDYQTMMDMLAEAGQTGARGNTGEAVSAAASMYGVYTGGAGGNSLADTMVYVKYNLKNNKTVYRCYQLTEDSSLDTINRVFSAEEFKEGSYPILTTNEEEILSAWFYNGIETLQPQLDHTGLLRLFRTFQEEYRNLTLYDMEEIPYGTLEFFRSETRGEAAYYVYPAMTETIRLLEEAGMQGWTAAGMDTATEAVVDIPDLYYELENQDEIELGETEGAYPEVRYSGEQLAAILPYIAENGWFWDNRMVFSQEYWMRVTLYAGEDEYGSERVLSCSFPAGRVPDFVREDLDYDRYLEMLN